MAAVAAGAAAGSLASWTGGTLLFTGGTDWATIGRSIAKGKNVKDEQREKLYPVLDLPTRLKVLANVRIMFVAAGPSAVHCMAGDSTGKLWTWGRNEKGQLGHGDLMNRNNPTVVEALGSKFIAGAAAGKHHSLCFTKEGEALAWGLNQQGQLGMGSIKKGSTKTNEDIQLQPVRSLLDRCTACAAGADFSMWIAGGGKLYSAGSPEHGQTGDGSDHAYNTKDSSIAIVFEPQPSPKLIPALADKTITRVACGHAHTIAVDDAGSAYTWGCGDYGRLGHKAQKDEVAPKKVEFGGKWSVPPDAVVAAGSTTTWCSASQGGMSALHYWGRSKPNGDSQMYPIMSQDMQGWNVRSVACGPTHFVIAADNSAITWGQATCGELGYGPKGKKSSANAAKCDALDDMHTHAVAAGFGWTLFLVDPAAPKVAKLAEFFSEAPQDVAVVEPADAGGKGGAKRKGAAASAEPAVAKKGKATKK